MGVSNCLMKALDIGKRPRREWKPAIEALPAKCPCQDVCTGGQGCRERISEYLRMQWHMAARRDKRKVSVR